MGVTFDRFQRIKTLFQEAMERAPDTRPAFLAEACGPDEGLRREVERLLDASEEADQVFEHVTPYSLPDLLNSDGPSMVGRRVGSYHLTQVIGFGGMGTVYEAVRADDHYRKRVAIKLIKRGMDTDLAIRRFRHERQILANLNHRNIAGLLDGGVTDDGRPYFVMEYVDGVPITRYSDERRLALSARLQLFRQVCGAVQYAHRNLVVHRDLKPGNILVTTDGTVKLLDFGIAKFLGEQEDPDAAPLTRGGMRALTPEYASPEMIRGLPITTSADIYSLGIVLYELVAGRRPFRLADQTFTAIERIVCEEPPPKPSAAAGPEAAERAGERNPSRYRKRLAGEVDNIVLMALRKEPERRYPSVEDLSQDLEKHLQGLPILAERDWAGYRLRKFVRRHLGAVVAAGLVLVSLVGGIIITTRQAARAERERVKAEATTKFLSQILETADRGESGKDATVVQAIDQAARRLDSALDEQPDVRAEIHSTLGFAYLSLAEYDRSERQFRAGLELSRQLYGSPSYQEALAINNIAAAVDGRGDATEADSLYREALQLAERSRNVPDDFMATAYSNMGHSLSQLGKFDEAEPYLRQAYELRRRSEPVPTMKHAQDLNNLAVLSGNRGHWAQAESLHRKAVAIVTRLYGPNHNYASDVLNGLAVALDEQGKYASAESAYVATLAIRRRVLGPEHPDYAATLFNYGMFLFARGRYREAADNAREVLSLRGKTLPDTHPAVAAALQTLGRSLDHLGDHDGAGQALEESLALRQKVYPPGHWLLATSTSVLGEHETLVGRYAAAERHLLAAYENLKVTRGERHARTVDALNRLVTLYEKWNRPADAARYRALLPQ